MEGRSIRGDDEDREIINISVLCGPEVYTKTNTKCCKNDKDNNKTNPSLPTCRSRGLNSFIRVS